MPFKPYLTTLAAVIVALIGLPVAAQTAPADGESPWRNSALPPETRARLLLDRMTLDEKLGLVRGSVDPPEDDSPGVAGFVPGVSRLGVAPLRESNAELGVAMPQQSGHDGPDDEATALPSGLATAASWNPEIAYANGAMIGAEARRKGFNVLLAGAANLARDPRSGRNFEYLGEDPLLAGILAGESIRGVQDQHVVSTLKHFALNDQESNRTLLDARIDAAALRESDLLAFEIALERGNPGAVMCAYNLVNGIHACENGTLLDDILRRQWHFSGWVMSDWGAVHSTAASALAGLDQESGAELDPRPFFGAPLKAALGTGAVPPARLDDMVLRILTAIFAKGVVDDPPVPGPMDIEADARVAEHAAEEGIVLLRNQGPLLPLPHDIRSIAVIGGHADIGVISGGGSSQVIPIGDPARDIMVTADGTALPFPILYDPSSPLKAIAARAKRARIAYSGGEDPAAAAALASQADVAIVFATKWESEGHDAEDLSLPKGQDRLIERVGKANPHTIVVLETGNPIAMPWLAQVAAVIEAWYPGARGGDAIARILFGDADPSGRLPITFPAGTDQLPRAEIPGRITPWGQIFTVDYREGADVGYRWFDARNLKPRFPFGFGLSYTSFRYGDLHLSGGATVSVEFSVTNEGSRAGADVAQVYARVPLPRGGSRKRLIGWRKVFLAPGETRRVSVTGERRLLAHFDETTQDWHVEGGRYRIEIGESALATRLSGSARVAAGTLPP